MNKSEKLPDNRLGALPSAIFLLSLLLSACGASTANLKAEDIGELDEDEIMALINAAAARDDISGVMQGLRMQFAAKSGLSPDAYPSNGPQAVDGSVIQCNAFKGHDIDIFMDRTKNRLKGEFMKFYMNPEVRKFLEKNAKVETFSGNITKEDVRIRQSGLPVKMSNKKRVYCAIAKPSSKKEQKSSSKQQKGKGKL